MSLTAQQKKALQTLKDCEGYADGWGIIVTDRGVRAEDGQAWVYYRTGLSLVKRGLVEFDEQFGRIRLPR